MSVNLKQHPHLFNIRKDIVLVILADGGAQIAVGRAERQL